MNTDQAKGWRKWRQIEGAYFDPADVTVVARAKSILHALLGHVDLTPDQARDVIDWTGRMPEETCA